MTVFKGLDEIVQCDCPIGKATTIGVGGNAEYFARPRTEEELREVLVRAEKAGIVVRALGRGSNLLVRDEGVPGVVVQLDAAGFGQITVEDDLLRAGAAAPLAKVVAEAARKGLAGVECLVGIPGSVGGAVRMNAGGAHGDIGQTVERVRAMDAYGQIFLRDRDDLLFGYRTSNVTARFILEADLRLMPDAPRDIAARMKRIWIAKKNSQPMNAASAGCVFKNPRGLSAGMMIDQCGLKGTGVGAAIVSRKHANYIVVKDKAGAKAADVLALIELVRNAVKERFSVSLELEIEIWP
jgi:UDP-N-acetylmuramate dehydrogenase